MTRLVGGIAVLAVLTGCTPSMGGSGTLPGTGDAPAGESDAVVSAAKKPATTTTTAGPVATTTTSTTNAPATTSTTNAPTTTTSPASVAIIDGSRVGLAQAYFPLWQSDAELARDLDAIRSTGARWVRFDFYWAALEPSRGSYQWGLTDRVVQAARARGLKVLATVAYTPAWARPGGTSDHVPPTNPDDYASFVRQAVRRYAPLGVRSWEIWNEPNSGDFWAPLPNAVAYTELLRRSYAAIHAEDPGATVISGGLAPAGGTLDYVSSDGFHISPWRFLSEMYQAGARGSFDALGHHPYPGMPYSPSTEAMWNAFHQTTALRDLMVARGDAALSIWGTEAGSWTGTSTWSITEAEQAQYVTDFMAGWVRWSYTGPFFYYSLRDRGTDAGDREDNFGLFRHDGSAKPAFPVFAEAVSGS